jgi:hypothetical protein
MSARRWLAAIAGAGASATVIAILVVPAACSTHQCDPQTFEMHLSDGTPTAGDFVDRNTWESTPLYAKWLHFGPAYTYTFTIPNFANRDLVATEAYVSVDEDPTGTSSGWTNAAGNIVVFANPVAMGDSLQIDVQNQTCGNYYLRVVLRAAPVTADAGSD